MTRTQLAACIDHTALKPDTTLAAVETLCREAVAEGFASVCIMPYYVAATRAYLDTLDSHVPVCTVIGFPNGCHTTATKVAEAQDAIANGATELDMVANIGALKSGRIDDVRRDVESVANAAHSRNAVVKVILETTLLADDEKRLMCEVAAASGADYVKTSTGFAAGGATLHDVQLMRSASPPHILIKASGGIRDYATAVAMINAGASRIGASASMAILSGCP